MWRAAGQLVFSMVVTVMVLGAISFFGPGSAFQTEPQDLAAGYKRDATEQLMLTPDYSAEDVSDGQVLQVLYEPDDGVEGGDEQY
jgi:hypothetical protein